MSEILGLDELEVLMTDITIRIQNQIVHHNRMGQLDQYLQQLPLDYELKDRSMESNNGKILVIGQSNVRKKDFRGILSSLNFDAERFELVLNYEEVKQYSFTKLAHNNHYDYIMVGPLPHKVKGLEDESSIITQIEKNSDAYPPLIRVLNQSGELKITKSSFKRALKENLI